MKPGFERPTTESLDKVTNRKQPGPGSALKARPVAVAAE
jgi:hypothetical protein